MSSQPSLSAEIVTPEELRRARADALATGRRAVEVLDEQLGLPAELFIARLGASFRFEPLSMTELRDLAPAFDVISYPEAMQRHCLTARDMQGMLLVVLDDPLGADLQSWVEEKIAEPFSWRLTYFTDLQAYLAQHEEKFQALDSVVAERRAKRRESTDGGIEDLSLIAISGESSEVVRLVSSTLRDALKNGASDIHFESIAAGLVIKFRIDGLLNQVKSIPDSHQAEEAISRIKVLAELDITERRVPQDGRFKAVDRGREIDFRVSIMPSIFGEDAVLRVLDKQALLDSVKVLSLSNLGFEPEAVRALRRMANEPYGMLLVTGPTGSGKTTTLYAAITEVNKGTDKIVTIEDPVEYQLPGVLQIPVNEKKGLTFAVGLRSILRHDPDRIMVGEIRDAETANIAVQSALTGHLVFTTVHANNAFDVIGRFMHMQVDLYSFVSALNGILAQRLLRLICPQCAVADKPDPQLIIDSGLAVDAVADYNFRIGRGCGHCRGTGYYGRKAIAEMLLLNDELRQLIISRAPAMQLKAAAHANGTRFLRESALATVRGGKTTLQEINRVTFVA